MKRSRKPKHALPLEKQMEAGRLYLLGQSLRGKVLCAKFGICHQSLRNFAKAYRALHPRGSAPVGDAVEN